MNRGKDSSKTLQKDIISRVITYYIWLLLIKIILLIKFIKITEVNTRTPRIRVLAVRY